MAQFNIQVSHDLTWNVEPILNEVKHALEQLINNEKTTVIDLRSIPLAPGEEDKIITILGQGEVDVTLQTLGLTHIVETNYSAVWLVTHFNTDDDIIGRYIEITKMPEILYAQSEDIVSSYQELVAVLADT
jgi:hydrogenase-1 operon protein HyaF